MTYLFIYGTFNKGKNSQKGGIIMANVKTDRKPLFGNRRSHACNATRHAQKPNYQKVKLQQLICLFLIDTFLIKTYYA